MQEVKKHEYLNNINSMVTLFSVVEFFSYMGLLIISCIFIYQALIFLDLYTMLLFIGYLIPFIFNLIIIRIFKKGHQSISSLIVYLLHSINELENKTK